MRIRGALIPPVLVSTSRLAACGGDDESGDPGPDSPVTESSPAGASDTSTGDSACDLLTTDEVAAAVGAPVKAGLPKSGPASTGGRFDLCVWLSDDPDEPADTATITLYPNAAAADSAREDDSQDVAGIGDKAFTVSFAGVWVYDGDRSFLAQWYALSGTDEDSLPKSEALAKAVVDKL